MDEGVRAPTPQPQPEEVEDAALEPSTEEREEEEVGRPRAIPVTTPSEMTAYDIITALLANSDLAHRTVYDPGQRKSIPIVLNHKDTTGYFGVYLNKPAWWFARLVLDGRSPWIGFSLPPERVQPLLPPGYSLLPPYGWAPSRVAIQGPDDLHALATVVVAAMQDVVEMRQPNAD